MYEEVGLSPFECGFVETVSTPIGEHRVRVQLRRRSLLATLTQNQNDRNVGLVCIANVLLEIYTNLIEKYPPTYMKAHVRNDDIQGDFPEIITPFMNYPCEVFLRKNHDLSYTLEISSIHMPVDVLTHAHLMMGLTTYGVYYLNQLVQKWNED